MLLRLREGLGHPPDVLVVQGRWSREFSRLMHRLQEPQTTASVVDPLMNKLADAELLLLSGATSFWQVMHHRVVSVTEDHGASVVKVARVRAVNR